MKGSTILIILLAIGAFVLLIPASVKCRLWVWDKNACAKVQEATETLKTFGVNVDPNAAPITQYDEVVSGLQNAA